MNNLKVTRKIILAVAATFISAVAMAAEPTIVLADEIKLVSGNGASSEQIIEAANLAVKSPTKRIAGQTMTFVALVPIKVDPGTFLPSVTADMRVDMTVVAKDGKFKVESSNPMINDRKCAPDAINEMYLPACETGMTGMQAHVANNILRQLKKNAQF